jgi:hypothetical protein
MLVTEAASARNDSGGRVVGRGGGEPELSRAEGGSVAQMLTLLFDS